MLTPPQGAGMGTDKEMEMTASPQPRVLDVSFKYENGTHTPTVLVGFAPDDYDARDAFARQLRAALSAAPVQQPAAEREQGEGPCTDADGCPTEMAVLKRFWRGQPIPDERYPSWYRAALQSPTSAAPQAVGAAAVPATLTAELVAALRQAEAWLDGWASAEPYLSVIREAIAKGDAALSASPSPASTSAPAERGNYTPLELNELASLSDNALAAAFRDIAARDYSKCYASLFRAHVLEKACSAPDAAPVGEPTKVTLAGGWGELREGLDFTPTGVAADERTSAAPDDMGARYTVEFDGFTGTVIGAYKRLDGEEGVVMQQDGCKVVHVYRRKWLKPAPRTSAPAPEGSQQ